MEITDRYRRFLKRRNFSYHTVKNYMSILSHFTDWLIIPLNEVTRKEIGSYVDHLMEKHLSAKTITCHLQTIRLFFDYLNDDEGIKMVNPVRKISIRLPKPLPRHLKDDQVRKFFTVITDSRDKAMFMLMLRCVFGWRRYPGSPWMQWSFHGTGSLSPTERAAKTGLSI